MATSAKSLTDAWAAITTAGQSGTIWLAAKPDSGRVLIDHSTTGTGALSASKSYTVPDSKDKITAINADDSSDIYYAKCQDTGATAVLVVDVL